MPAQHGEFAGGGDGSDVHAAAGFFIPVNNSIEADQGRLKSRLRPMRGLKRLRSARVISVGHAFVQNLRPGHYEFDMDVDPKHRRPADFAELAFTI